MPCALGLARVRRPRCSKHPMCTSAGISLVSGQIRRTRQPPLHAMSCSIPGSGWPVPTDGPLLGTALTMDREPGRKVGSPPPTARLLGQPTHWPLTSKATAAIKLISFLIYTRLSLGEVWADRIKVCKWCAYAISFNPLMPSCQNKTLKKGFEGSHMGIMAFPKRVLSTW